MIRGERVRLRAIEKADLPAFVRWLNDPEIRQGISLNRPISLDEEEEWFADLLKKPQQERPLAIEIQPDPDKEEWAFVGNCGLFDIDWESRSAEIGIHIGEKKYWDQGFGTRVMRLVCKHAFGDLNLHRVWLRVFETNQRAIRAYEKAGFTQEGRFREGKHLDGKYVDVLIMSVLRPEWQEDQ